MRQPRLRGSEIAAARSPNDAGELSYPLSPYGKTDFAPALAMLSKAEEEYNTGHLRAITQ